MSDLEYKNVKEKKKKECPFSITKMNKYYLFPFLVPIVCFSTKFCTNPMKSGLKDRQKVANPDVEHTFVFIYLFINGTSHILGGLLYFISVLKTEADKPKSEDNLFDKIEKTRSNQSNKKENSIKSNNNTFDKIAYFELLKDRYRKIKIFAFLILMAFILTVYVAIKGYATGHPQLEKRLYFLFFFTLFNIFISKREIFIHQKVSLGIALIGMAILFTYFFYSLGNDYYFVYDVLLFFGSFFYSLYLFLIKHLTVNYSLSPFFVILFIGIFSTAFSTLGFISFSLINKGNLSYISNLFHCSETSYVCFGDLYLHMISYFFINAILQVLIVLVIYYFCPEVFAISDIISPMLSFFNKCIEKNNTNLTDISINTLGYIIILLGAFIYNELIVCNFCGLNKNTWKAIEERGKEEVEDRYSDSNSVDDYIIGVRDSIDKEEKGIELKNNINNNNINNNNINNNNINNNINTQEIQEKEIEIN